MIPQGVKKWVLKAMEDFRIAKQGLSFPEPEIATGPICFHSQQVAEKLLKAYLVSRNIDFAKTHDLAYLRELCAQQDPEFKKIDLGNLKFYAVEVRYADEFYLPSIDEAKEAFELANKVKAFVFKKLGIKEQDL